MHPDYLNQLRTRANRRARAAPKPMAELVVMLSKSRLFRSANRLDRFQEAWKSAASEVLGAEIAAETDVSGHAKGDLKVVVSSPGLAREIKTFHAEQLVAAVNRVLNGKDRIARLQVRSGVSRRTS